MEQYIVSARKYRPATFETVVGQQSVTNTLKNAIRNNQLAQAFLFCGPRGVGKTTCARLLAKAVNSTDIENIHLEETDEFNIIELDAASNNTVDDIRSLIEQVRIPPSAGKKYKTYIIDEVHMLSSSAFNAFLKTLEEPPAYAIFILATTEKHKILPTILSRCQIFDFQRIKIKDIADHLADIAKKENIHADPDALHIIAQKADGGLRDALSMFDQMATFTGRNLTYESVIENLNILDYDFYFKVTDAILENHIPQALLTFSEIMDKGFEGQSFLTGLSEHFRNLLVCKDPATLKLLEVGENIKEKYIKQSTTADINLLLQGLDKLSEADVNFRMSKNQRLLVELTLMQLCSLHADAEKKNDIKIIPASAYRNGTYRVVEVKKPVIPAEPLIIEKTEVRQEKKSITAEPPEQPQKKVTANTMPAKPGAFLSIRNMAEKKEPTTQTETLDKAAENLPSSPFSQERLMELWLEYASRVRTAGKESFYVTLISAEPVADGNILQCKLDNLVQKKDFDREQSDLLEFLRKELNNFSLSLNLVVEKKLENTKHLSGEDKLKALIEKYPDLLNLVTSLGLHPEY